MKQEKEREPTDPRTWLDRSAVLVSRDDVQAAVAKMAAEINAHYGERPLIVQAPLRKDDVTVAVERARVVFSVPD